MQDAQKLLNGHMEPVEIQDLKLKDKNLFEILCAPTPPYNEIVKCSLALNFGIEATKYNFKNSQSRSVILQINDDETKLVYQDLKDSGKMF